MKKLIYLAIAIAVILGFFFIETTDKGEPIQEQPMQSAIDLSFIPQPITEIQNIAFDNTWNLRKTVQLSNVSGVKKVLVLFYETNDGEIKLILQDKDKFYDLGIEAKPEDAEAIVKDINNDGINELIISANLGATVKAVKIISFSNEKWVYLLNGENLIVIDLDAVGTSEIVETSMGSLPGYANIYRWNGSQYEKSDLLKDSGSANAAFMLKENKPVFELTNDNKAEIYRYQNGKLEPFIISYIK